MTQEIKLTLGKQERTFTFGILFIGEVLERTDLDYNALIEKVIKNPFKYAPILMYESLRNTAKRIGKELDFTENEMVTWLEQEENLGTDLMIKFVYAFLGTNGNPTPTENVENGNVKKK